MSGNFLVVIDGTPECESAVRYAARRSELAEKELVVIVAIDNQKEGHWLGVERKIIEEAEENTKILIEQLQKNISGFSKVNISYEILHGSKISIVNNMLLSTLISTSIYRCLIFLANSFFVFKSKSI